MPLFMCRKCGSIDNSALAGGYWYARAYNKPEQMVCTECGTGLWHGQFPKKSAGGMLIDQDGHLYGTDEHLPKNYKIMGVVMVLFSQQQIEEYQKYWQSISSGCYSEPSALQCQLPNTENKT